MRAFESIRSLARRWHHLHDLPFEDVPDTRVGILIGCDVPEAHWVLDQRIGGREDPYALRTMFGWILCGPLGNDGNYSTSINFISRSDNPIKDDLERLYNHEFGNIADDRVSMSRKDRATLAVVTETTRHNETQFEVPLSWRTGSNRLPHNREVVLHRLNYLNGRLKKAYSKEAYRNAI
ncbi:unnamed protein product [Echinostoma caproni]|uniref:DUF2235 domain-containing protein n=1 Tax=Echinostoma caproni TaxID=27848 RepID=A0A183AAQ1_9TREM|nr:unnamed protein product [Echinostoma caproni]